MVVEYKYEVNEKKKKIFFFWIWEFLLSDLGKHLIFALGIGAEIRPQNGPRKIPAYP